MSFSSDIAKFAKKAGENMVTTRKSVFFQLAESIVERTPVDTGRAKGNWQPSLHTFKSGTVAGASDPIPAIKMVADSANGDDSMCLINNLPYIQPLEYGYYGEGPKVIGGYSSQAPRGMVRITVREFKVALRKAVAGLK